MAGFGGRDRGLDGLPLPHFTDHDDVGVLPHDVLQGLREARRVGSDFSLRDGGFPFVEEVLDRVLDGDDMDRSRLDDRLHDRGERRRLAGSCGPGDQDETGRKTAEGLQNLGQAELGAPPDLIGDPPEGGGEGAPLDEEVRPKPSHSRQAVTDVHRLVLLEPLSLSRGQDLQENLLEVRGLEDFRVDRDEPPLHPQQGRPHRLQMEVGGLLPCRELE